MYSACPKTCYQCYPDRNPLLKKYSESIVENEHMVAKPLKILQNGRIEEPAHVNGVLLLPNSHIDAIFLKTLIYVNIRELDVSNNPLTWLPEMQSLEKLNCSGCKLTALPSPLPKLKELKCADNYLSTVPYYKNLVKLECSNNLIQDLSQYNNSKLESLIATNNPLTSINIPSLTYLEAYDCPLLVIHNLPSLHKKSSVIINNEMKFMMFRKEKISKERRLIDWYDNTCDIAVYNKLVAVSDFFFRLAPFLFTPVAMV